MKIYKLKNLLSFVALTFTYFCFGQYSGTVYWDTNQNGKQDKKEKGIPNAVVSNGLQVIKTDTKGNFSLPNWEKARFVTLYPNPGQKTTNRFIRITDTRDSYNFEYNP